MSHSGIAGLSLSFVLVGVFSGTVSAQTTAPRLSGVLTDDAGNSVSNVPVAIKRLDRFRMVRGADGVSRPVLQTGILFQPVILTTDSAGRFQPSNLAKTAYHLCFTPPAPFLANCKWDYPVYADLTSATSLALPTRVLARGGRLILTLDDSQRLIARHNALNVGVEGPNGAYNRLAMTSDTPALATYELLVPRGVPLRLWVFSNQAAFRNSARTPLSTVATSPGGYYVIVTIPANQTELRLQLEAVPQATSTSALRSAETPDINP